MTECACRLAIMGAVALGAVLGSTETAAARWRAPCGVQYQRADYSWSQFYNQECNFFFGQELNTATGTFNFRPLEVYVAVWWGDDQVTIIAARMLIILDMDANMQLDHLEGPQAFQVQSAFLGTSEGGRRNWRVSMRRGLLGDWSTF